MICVLIKIKNDFLSYSVVFVVFPALNNVDAILMDGVPKKLITIFIFFVTDPKPLIVDGFLNSDVEHAWTASRDMTIESSFAMRVFVRMSIEVMQITDDFFCNLRCFLIYARPNNHSYPSINFTKRSKR